MNILNENTVTEENFERTWWRLLQKRVVRTNFDMYVFIVDLTFYYYLLI
jgi:hypothetical protein